MSEIELTAAERYALRHKDWEGLLDGGPLESALSKLAATVGDHVPEEIVVVEVTLPGNLAEDVEFGTRDEIGAMTLWQRTREALAAMRGEGER